MSALGRHILVEFFRCSPEILDNVTAIETAMVEAAKEADATVINSTFHHFSPYGVSGVVVIQESHLAIHTWPEFQYAAVDIFTCGDQINPWVSYDFLKKAFEAEQGSAMEINRGQTDLLERVNYKPKESTKEEREVVRPQFKRDVWFTDKDDNVALSLRHTGEVLFRKKSPYQMVQVLDTYAYGKMLTIDNIIMTTEKDECAYHEMITHVPLLTLPEKVERVLVIGGGDGGTIREVLKHDKVEQVTMVEIDEVVVEASKLHLPTLSQSFAHPKLQLLFYDGIKYLADCTAETFDLIIVDGSDPVGPAEGLFTVEFYQNIYRCLKSNGVLVLQSEGPSFSKKIVKEIHTCLSDIFTKEKVHTYLAYIPTYPTGMWSFMYASKGKAHPLEHLNDEQAKAFATAHNLQYYNVPVHKGAFALPTFVQNMLEE